MMIGMPVHKGFDSAVSCREQDHLNRWPLAQEVYGIATTGPADWSVRIGIYGEWGTGKTSVLNFVESIGQLANQIVVRFNPWEYTTRDALWRAFVLATYAELKEQIPHIQGAKKALVKEWATKITGAIEGISKMTGSSVAVLNKEAGGIVGTVGEGLGLVKQFLVFGKDDLEKLHAILGQRRMLILIDDLDRTSPNLVPEMLFAFKEIMDVPGFSFICAFDPIVVGEVLGEYHPGFGDGLKFLEKIIDYPRWLPSPTAEGMRALAHADIRLCCPYVPLAVLDDALPLLPNNPRVLRQFIRLLALMKPQIDRHYEHELFWPVIVAANVVKILHPHIARELFADENVWAEIRMARLTATAKEKGEEEISDSLTQQVQKAAARHDLKLPIDDQNRILKALRRIAEWPYAWVVDYKMLAYQIHVAEAPLAVTRREFDEFWKVWKKQKDANAVKAWIRKHAAKVGRKDDEVYSELLDLTVRTRDEALGRAADVALDAEMLPLLDEAGHLLTLLEQLVFASGGITSDMKRLGENEVQQIVSSLLKYAAWRGKKEYRKLRKQEEDFLQRLVEDWSNDVTPLMNVFRPLRDISEFMSSEPARKIRKALGSEIVSRFARQTLENLRQQGFVERIRADEEVTYDAKRILLAVDGPLWKGLRKEAVQLLGSAADNTNIQLNVIEMLCWIDRKFHREPGFPDTTAAEKLLQNKQICHALWRAATVKPLNPRFCGGLRDFPTQAEKLGTKLSIPRWWLRALKELEIAQKSGNHDASTDAPEAVQNSQVTEDGHENAQRNGAGDPGQ
jgi:hypothetical protein